MTIKQILFASDFSRASRPAFHLARALARAFEAELALFHAWQRVMPVAGEGHASAPVLERIWKATREDAARGVQRLAGEARRGGVAVATVVAEGPAAAAIVRAARSRRAGLIVVGTHGRTGVRRLLLGSVAERVVRTASCPVVTVNART